jgi:hypothetical protein
MIDKKTICFSLVLLIALLTSTAIDQRAAKNSIRTRADGTAPPAPPIPYNSSLGHSLSADGTAPPAPPIPNAKASVLQADGTAPPAPPIPWKYSGIAV